MFAPLVDQRKRRKTRSASETRSERSKRLLNVEQSLKSYLKSQFYLATRVKKSRTIWASQREVFITTGAGGVCTPPGGRREWRKLEPRLTKRKRKIATTTYEKYNYSADEQEMHPSIWNTKAIIAEKTARQMAIRVAAKSTAVTRKRRERW
jgi:hypothetical protein